MKALIGKVVSTKSAKTAVVEVITKWQHPLYNKTVKKAKKYMAHDEIGVEMGQEVSIVPCRPVSKKKRWSVAEVITDSSKVKK